MNLDELAVDYYHSSLAFAQKSLIAGLTVAGIAYLVAITGDPQSSYTIPLIEVEVTSLIYFSIALLTLFLACGAACFYGVSKALDNWRLISDKELSFRLLQVPNLFMSGIVIDSLLYGFIIMVGMGLSKNLLALNDWQAVALGIVIAFPYFCAFRTSSDLRHLSKNQLSHDKANTVENRSL